MMNTAQSKKILTHGLGVATGKVAFYIEHPPRIEPYNNLIQVSALASGEIEHINAHCGNGWRKIFNVFAKFLFAARLPITILLTIQLGSHIVIAHYFKLQVKKPCSSQRLIFQQKHTIGILLQDAPTRNHYSEIRFLLTI